MDRYAKTRLKHDRELDDLRLARVRAGIPIRDHLPWRGQSNPAVQLLTERIAKAFERLPAEARARYAHKLVNAKGKLAKRAVLRLDYQWISLYVAA